MESLELTKAIAKVLDAKKGEDIKAIKTEDLTIVSDYVVIVSGTSTTHVKALADELEYEMGKLGVKPDHIEGKATGWILLDYGTVIVHVFMRDSREYYNLERLWSDADSIDLSDVITEN